MKIQYLFFLFTSLFFITNAYSETCRKTVRWSNDPPFYFLNSKEEIVGIDADITREIFKKLNCTPVFVEYPWARALLQLRSGKLDILTGVYKTSERENYALFSNSSLSIPNVLFVRTKELDKWKFGNLSDIVDLKFILGVQLNVSYSSEYAQLVKKPEFFKQLQFLSNRNALWQMLKHKRVDGVIADELTGPIELKKLKLEGFISPTSFIVSNEQVFTAFSKITNSLEFVEKYDNAKKAIEKNGTYKKIIKSYRVK